MAHLSSSASGSRTASTYTTCDLAADLPLLQAPSNPERQRQIRRIWKHTPSALPCAIPSKAGGYQSNPEWSDDQVSALLSLGEPLDLLRCSSPSCEGELLSDDAHFDFCNIQVPLQQAHTPLAISPAAFDDSCSLNGLHGAWTVASVRVHLAHEAAHLQMNS